MHVVLIESECHSSLFIFTSLVVLSRNPRVVADWTLIKSHGRVSFLLPYINKEPNSSSLKVAETFVSDDRVWAEMVMNSTN